MKKLTLDGEKEIIRNMIDGLYKEIDYWDNRLNDLERARSKGELEKWKTATESLIATHDDIGKISTNQLTYWALKLRVEPMELLTYLEEEVVNDKIVVV